MSEKGDKQKRLGTRTFDVQGFSVGGAVSDLSLLERAAMTVRPRYSQQEKDWIAAREMEYADYNKAIDEYNKGVSDYQKLVDAYNESLKPYQSEVDAYEAEVAKYNKAAELYNQREKVLGDVQYWTSNYGATPYNLGVSYSADENRRKNQMIRDAGLKPGSSGLYDVSFFLPEDGLYDWQETRGTPGGVIFYGDLYKRGGAYPGDFTAKPPGNPPPAFTGVEPTAPTNVPYTQEQVQQYVDTAKERANRMASSRAMGLKVAADPSQYGLSGFSVGLPFKNGGEVSNEDFIEQMMTGTPPADQGSRPYDQTAVAQLADYLRAPVDLAQTAARGLVGSVVGPAYGVYKGVTGGKYGTPEGVREASQAGGELMQRITGEPQSQAARDVLEFIGKKSEEYKLAPIPQLMTLPVPGPGALRYPAEAAKTKAEDIALRAVRSQTENPDITAAELYNAMLGKQAPGAAAVKPRGGITLTTKGSPLGNYIEDVLDSVKRDGYRATVPKDKRAKVENFIAKKMPKYIRSDFGTENDPIREAIQAGRIDLFGRDKEKLRGYALAAAREGEPEALQDVTQAYDRGTGLRPYVITPDTDDYRVTTAAKEKAVENLVQKMVAEGADENLARSILSERLEGVPFKDIAAVADDGDIRKNFGSSAQVLASFGGKDQAEFIKRAVEQGDVAFGLSSYNLLQLFEPEAIAKTIGAVPVEKLSRMSFPEAFIEGTNLLKATRDFDLAIETARRGKGSTLPKEVLSFGTKPQAKVKSGQWVRITDPLAAKLEGALMGHSVGGYGEEGSYNIGGKKALLSGKANLFSLRDEKGLPMATIEMEDMNAGTGKAPDFKIRQTQGRFNSAPEEYMDDAFDLADNLNARWPEGLAGDQTYHVDRSGKGLDEVKRIKWGDLYRQRKQNRPPEGMAEGGEVTKFIQANA